MTLEQVSPDGIGGWKWYFMLVNSFIESWMLLSLMFSVGGTLILGANYKFNIYAQPGNEIYIWPCTCNLYNWHFPTYCHEAREAGSPSKATARARTRDTHCPLAHYTELDNNPSLMLHYVSWLYEELQISSGISFLGKLKSWSRQYKGYFHLNP